jgi:hypothetical protein
VVATQPAHAKQPAPGLTGEEAGRLLAQHGPNAIAEARGPSHLRQFLADFVGLLALLLPVRGRALAGLREQAKAAAVRSR